MNKRYTLVRIYRKDLSLDAELIDCKTLKEAIDLGTCLSEEEKVLGSHIIDNVKHCKLTLKGEGYRL